MRGTSAVFLGFMFLGLGIGLALKMPECGILIGMGIGFLAVGIIKLKTRKQQ